MLAAFTSAEGADVVDVLAAHAALTLLLEGLFLEDVGLSLRPLCNKHTHGKMRFSARQSVKLPAL